MNEKNDKTGNTALHYAVMHNDKKIGKQMAKVLLKNNKVKTNIENKLNKTPMDIIASQITSKYWLWNIERVIWIAFYKNEDNTECDFWPHLPKVIVTEILKFVSIRNHQLIEEIRSDINIAMKYYKMDVTQLYYEF